MFRIMFALLLLILLETVYESAASHTELSVSRVHISKCGCKVVSNGRIWCRSPLFGTKYVKIQDLVECFCRKTNRHKFPEFQAACKSSFIHTLL